MTFVSSDAISFQPRIPGAVPVHPVFDTQSTVLIVAHAGCTGKYLKSVAILDISSSLSEECSKSLVFEKLP